MEGPDWVSRKIAILLKFKFASGRTDCLENPYVGNNKNVKCVIDNCEQCIFGAPKLFSFLNLKFYTMSNLRLAWSGSYEDLKNLVGEELKLNGTWQQPGGYKKVFTDNETSISWLKDKKTLTFEEKSQSNLNERSVLYYLGNISTSSSAR